MTTDPQVLAFIWQLREEHPRLSKGKIKPSLDRHCQSREIRSPAGALCGSYRRVGYRRLDTLVRELDRRKVYFYSAIDVKSKVALSLPCSRLNSRNASDFLEKLQNWYTLPIREVQTDNGAEFEGEFDAYLRTRHIPHVWSYLRCPRINGCVECYRRTLSEEFIQVHEDSIRRPHEFLRHLREYLVFHNSERIHSALGNQTPLAFLLSQGQMSRMPVASTLA